MSQHARRFAALSVVVILSGQLARAADAPPAAVPHTFRYAPAAGAPTIPVVVAGDFNGWSTTANPMPRGADGAYTVTLNLTPGKHAYKFVCDGHWTPDPAADKSLDADDGQGGWNSVADVAAVGAVPHTFRYAPPAGSSPAAVFVAGDFNGWSTTATPVARGADGVYTATVAVPAGVHAYKFVADGKWSQDPAADAALDTDDGNGGKNSGFRVGPAPAK